MCKEPAELANGETVRCQKCEDCQKANIKIWVGKCMAEARTSAHTLCVTLTYGQDQRYRNVEIDHPNAHVLTYSDVQDYLKRLRLYTKGIVRFMATGEYGDEKGRAHWHLILFFSDGLPPNIRLDERYVHDAGVNDRGQVRTLWPHGYSFWQEAVWQKIHYAVSYIEKDVAKGQTREHRFSKHPPLGYRWFRRLALRYVDQGLSPQDYIYSFPENRGPDGMPFRFQMSPASAYYFGESFMDAWERVHGASNWPQSAFIDECFEERARRDRRSRGISDEDWDTTERQLRLADYERRGLWVVDVNGKSETNGALMQVHKPSPSIDGGEAYKRRSKGV